MWINEVMANSIEENFNLNLEWIPVEDIGEGIGTIDKDCIVIPSSPCYQKVELEDDENFPVTQGLIEIEVTEEEVVAGDWNIPDGRDDDPVCHLISEAGDVSTTVPLLEGQDEYFRLHPYPCDFCSRRFSKKSMLSSHMLTHQLEEFHRCSVCGIQYRRKLELVEHMKIHSVSSMNQSSVFGSDYGSGPQSELKKVKKKSSKKKGKWQDHFALPSVSFNKKVNSELGQIFNINKSLTSPNEKFIDIPIKTELSSDEDFTLCGANGEKFPVLDPSRPYVCQHCGVGFARQKALNSHTMIHVGDSAYECEKCHDMFQSEEHLRQHKFRKHIRIYSNNKKSVDDDDKLKPFKCDQCDLSFSWYNQLKRHQRNQHAENRYNEEKLICNLCNVSFKTENSFLIHKEVHKASTEIYSCTTCGEEFCDADEVELHMKVKHDCPHLCHSCGSAYKDSKALRKHLLTHLDQPKSYHCPTCNRLFHNRGKLKKHVEAAHDGNQIGECGECGQKFPDASCLAIHRQSVHGTGRLFPCTQCGKTFTSRSSQQIHVRVHTGEKPYGCRFCWKAFADGGTLRKHERIHTGEKPYVCPVCSKAFNQRVVLREHVRAHHSGAEGRGRTFECIVCGEIFSESLELCAHLVMHSDENTAKHRLPNTSTRKYNRRRKPPNVNLSVLSSEESDSGQDFLAKTARKKVKPSESINEAKGTELLVGDGRARILRSCKRGIKGQNKRFLKGRGKATRLMNSASYASKYVVTPTDVNNDKEFVQGSSSRVRPRTPNVTDSQSLRGEPKYQITNYSNHKNKPFLISSELIKKEPDILESQYINGMDTSAMFDVGHGVPIGTCIDDDIGVELKLEVRTSESEDLSVPTNTESIIPDIKVETTELVSCEICYETFSARSDLLKHIQVHI